MTDRAPFVARLEVDAAHPIGRVHDRVFGGFVEHMGRGVYGGLFDPEHPSADAEGFRRDVLDLVRELGITMVRYPGGNFVSGYRWEDGVGPVEQRPRRFNLAWHSTESNRVGLHEFARWAELVGAELMLAANLGTRGVLEALDLAEYALHPAGTARADERRANGREEPFPVRLWCLGNEMDGPWQLGQQTADEYGRLASRTAKGLRQLDPTLELVACGSSGPLMPTFGSWERTVLRHAYDDVDLLSAHFYAEPVDGDLAAFLASGVALDRYLDEVIGIADAVGDELGSVRTLGISVDEWNVWYQSRMAASLPTGDDWPEAPALNEDDYSLADSVVVGDLLISLLRRADRVAAACLAQVVNVIAPIAAPADAPAWRRATFHPFALTARHARGESLPVAVDAPLIAAGSLGEAPAVSAAAVRTDHGGLTLLLVNRDLEREADATVVVAGIEPGARVLEAVSLSGPDPLDASTIDAPDRVSPCGNTSARVEAGGVRVTLPAVSWSLVRVGR